jgi:hypothetical protein
MLFIVNNITIGKITMKFEPYSLSPIDFFSHLLDTKSFKQSLEKTQDKEMTLYDTAYELICKPGKLSDIKPQDFSLEDTILVLDRLFRNTHKRENIGLLTMLIKKGDSHNIASIFQHIKLKSTGIEQFLADNPLRNAVDALLMYETFSFEKEVQLDYTPLQTLLQYSEFWSRQELKNLLTLVRTNQGYLPASPRTINVAIQLAKTLDAREKEFEQNLKKTGLPIEEQLKTEEKFGGLTLKEIMALTPTKDKKFRSIPRLRFLGTKADTLTKNDATKRPREKTNLEQPIVTKPKLDEEIPEKPFIPKPTF